MHLHELIVQRRVGDRGEMKNRVEFFVAELFAPIQRGQILRDEIAAITLQILEIAGAKIVDHGQPRVREFVLQREHQVRADEAGAAGDERLRCESDAGKAWERKQAVRLIK